MSKLLKLEYTLQFCVGTYHLFKTNQIIQLLIYSIFACYFKCILSILCFTSMMSFICHDKRCQNPSGARKNTRKARKSDNLARGSTIIPLSCIFSPVGRCNGTLLAKRDLFFTWINSCNFTFTVPLSRYIPIILEWMTILMIRQFELFLLQKMIWLSFAVDV